MEISTEVCAQLEIDKIVKHTNARKLREQTGNPVTSTCCLWQSEILGEEEIRLESEKKYFLKARGLRD
uniref:Transposase n=1 Tax=Angiostrongylus cantonensis TaxID=6313 RepID=A0A0K0CUY4_ANGCA